MTLSVKLISTLTFIAIAGYAGGSYFMNNGEAKNTEQHETTNDQSNIL